MTSTTTVHNNSLTIELDIVITSAFRFAIIQFLSIKMDKVYVVSSFYLRNWDQFLSQNYCFIFLYVLNRFDMSVLFFRIFESLFLAPKPW